MKSRDFTTRSGKTLPLTEIGFGTAPLGDLFKRLDEAEAQNTVRSAYADGVRMFDSSPHYGNGLAEARLGAALRDKPRADLVISPKIGRWMDPFTPVAELRSEGTVKAIGIGVNEGEVCARFARAGDFDVMLLAGRYSLLEQPALASFLPLAVERNIGIILAGVFNSGILATGAVPDAKYNYSVAPAEVMNRVREIEAVCKAHGVALRQAAMRFAVAHPAVVCLLLGAETAAEIRANVADVDVKVPDALWADLKRKGLLNGAAPTP